MSEAIARDAYDRQLGLIEDLPDVLSTRPSTIVDTVPIVGLSQTFIVQSYRQREVGDRIFIQYLDAAGTQRLVIPPKVADAIARQRSALTKKSRSKAARESQDGRQPGFLKMSAEDRTKAREKGAATRARNAEARRRRRQSDAHAKSPLDVAVN
jgi:hypothetical protein